MELEKIDPMVGTLAYVPALLDATKAPFWTVGVKAILESTTSMLYWRVGTVSGQDQESFKLAG